MTSESPRNFLSYTVEDLKDPNISPATLKQLSVSRHDLWDEILAHPNCYERLADSIRQSPSERHLKSTIMPTNPPPVHKKVIRKPSRGPQKPPMKRNLQISLVWVAVIGIMSLFLPVASRYRGFNYFQDRAPDGVLEIGVMLLIAFLVVLGFGLAAAFSHGLTAEVWAPLLGVLLGLFATHQGFVRFSEISGDPALSLGFGTTLLILSSVALMVIGIMGLTKVSNQEQ